MKNLLPFSALLLTAAFAHADLVIEQKMESAIINGEMIMKIKGDQARMDMPSPAGQATVLMDMKTGEMTTLMHAQKLALKMNMSDAKKAAADQQKQTGIDLSKLTPKDTGTKEKVGQWNCEVFTLDMGNGMTSKMWVSKEYPNYKSIMDQMNKISAAASAGMGIDMSKFDLGGMTVKSEVTTPSGKIVSTLVSAKEESVADSEFTAPAGYTEMKLPTSGK